MNPHQDNTSTNPSLSEPVTIGTKDAQRIHETFILSLNNDLLNRGIMITEFSNQTDVPVEEMTYEQALNILEHIILALESNQPSLDEALQLYERGQRLVQLCLQQLNQAELKLSQLSKEESAGNPMPD